MPSVNAGARIVTSPAASMTKELPSNTSSSWPPIRLTNTSGIPVSPTRTRADLPLSLPLLVHFVGRGIDDQQHLRAGAARLQCGLGVPDVLAHQDPRLDAVQFDHRGFGARGEIALLVEHPVIGQAGLAVICQHRAVANDDGGIVDSRPVVFRIAGDQRDAAHLGFEALDRARDLCAHARMEQQILRRVSRDGQLGQHHQVGGGLLARLVRRGDDARGIALDRRRRPD